VDEASILRGQHMDYLRQALTDYRAGKRTAVAAMDRKVQALSEEQIEALVHYYASPVEGGG
jgi:sulfide dehydrogenase cytochrome subunit